MIENHSRNNMLTPSHPCQLLFPHSRKLRPAERGGRAAENGGVVDDDGGGEDGGGDG